MTIREFLQANMSALIGVKIMPYYENKTDKPKTIYANSTSFRILELDDSEQCPKVFILLSSEVRGFHILNNKIYIYTDLLPHIYENLVTNIDNTNNT